MAEKTCPQCENHCSADALKCGKGEKYFGVQHQEKDISSMTPEERILILLRKCGHHLHHNVGHDTDAAALVNMLTTEEKTSLEEILQKCLQHWKS